MYSKNVFKLFYFLRLISTCIADVLIQCYRKVLQFVYECVVLLLLRPSVMLHCCNTACPRRWYFETEISK